MAMRLICIAVALLGYATVARLQGGAVVNVQFSESDYERHEEADSLALTVSLVGPSINDNNVALQVNAYTRQQFVSRGITCNNPPNFSVEIADEGEETELVSNFTTCSGVPSAEPGTKILCSFDIVQDGSLERDEYLVFVMRLTNNNGYNVNVGRDCTIGRISAHESLAVLTEIGYPLVITNSAELIEVNEGSSVVFHIEKRFQTELDITVKFEISNDPPGSSNPLLSGSSQNDDFIISQVIIPAGTSSVDIPMEIVDDALVERTEYLSIIFLSRVSGLDIGSELPIANNRFNVAIHDNDVLRGGLDTPNDVVTVTEGKKLVICVEVIELNQINVLRQTALELRVVDGSAMSGTHFNYFMNGGGSSIINLEEGPGCITIYTMNNALAEGNKMLQVDLIDNILAELSDPADAESYRQLNVIEPTTVTVVIRDDEGPPNQPNIMIIGSVPNIGSQLRITWETGDEDGAHPFVCHFGIITERSNDLEKEISFDFDLCNMDPPSTSKQFNFQNFDPIKTYTVVVCSKNLLGHNCSDPVVVYEPVLSPGPGSVLYKEPTLSPGIIAVIVIVVLIVVSCCLVLVLLLIFCLCCKETLYKNYRPEKREQKFGALAHGHDARYLSEESVEDKAEPHVYS